MMSYVTLTYQSCICTSIFNFNDSLYVLLVVGLDLLNEVNYMDFIVAKDPAEECE